MKKKQKKLGSDEITVGVILLLGILAILGIIYLPSPLEEENEFESEYNGYEFRMTQQGFWAIELSTIYGDEYIPFRNHPSEVDSIPYGNVVDGFNIVNGNQGEFRLGISPEYSESGLTTIAGIEIVKVTSHVFGLQSSAGVTTEVEETNVTEEIAEGSDEVYNCSQASEEIYIVELRQGEEQRLTTNGTCTIIESPDGEGLIEGANLFVYLILGIIE